MNITWTKSKEISCELGLIQAGMIIEVNDEQGKRLIESGFEETNKEPTHYKNEVGKWISIAGKVKTGKKSKEVDS